MKIGSFDTEKSVFMIAEIGNNHEGSLEMAKNMIRTAAEAGADAVKFQSIVPERLVSADQLDRLGQLRRYAFQPSQFRSLKEEADRAGVFFLSTPFDPDSVDFLDEIVPAFKIASGDSNFRGLLQKVAETGKPVMVSTGLSDRKEKEELRSFFHEAWRKSTFPAPGLALLHCVSEYPTPEDRAGLVFLRELASMQDITPGYSDHTLGLEAAVLAVGVGARILEKHFTLDKSRSSFRDHALSADPEDFCQLVRRVRQAESMLGRSQVEGAPTQVPAARRSAAAVRDLPKGHRLEPKDLIWLRPGTGFPPGSETLLVGRTLARPVPEGILLREKDFCS